MMECPAVRLRMIPAKAAPAHRADGIQSRLMPEPCPSINRDDIIKRKIINSHQVERTRRRSNDATNQNGRRFTFIKCNPAGSLHHSNSIRSASSLLTESFSCSSQNSITISTPFLSFIFEGILAGFLQDSCRILPEFLQDVGRILQWLVWWSSEDSPTIWTPFLFYKDPCRILSGFFQDLSSLCRILLGFFKDSFGWFPNSIAKILTTFSKDFCRIFSGFLKDPARVFQGFWRDSF